MGDRLHESLISREELMDEIRAEIGLAQLRNSRTKVATLRKVLDIISGQKVYGEINPIAIEFFGG